MIPLSVSKPESGFRIRNHWLKETLDFQEKAPSDIVASIKKWFPSTFPQRPKQLIQGTELSRKGNPNLIRTFARGLNSQWHLDTQSASSDWSTQLKHDQGTSLVVQWLRICLPMQGTQVQSLVGEDSTWFRATKPVHHNYWSLRALEPGCHKKRSHCSEKPANRNKQPSSPQVQKALP